jgi:hypothetical protein
MQASAEVRLEPIDGQLPLYLVGKPPGNSQPMREKTPSSQRAEVQTTLVAGARNQRYLHLDHAVL